MNEVILETMKETDDKFWHLQNQIDTLSEIVHILEERIKTTGDAIKQTCDACKLLTGEVFENRKRIREIDAKTGICPLDEHIDSLQERIVALEGPPIPKPNPKHTPGRVEMREMLLSAVKDLYGKLYLSDEEKTAMSTFECFLSIEDIGWDSRTDVVANYWLPGNIKKLRNHHLEEALRILGVME